MNIPTKDIQNFLRQKNWKKLMVILDELPVTSEVFGEIKQLVWFSDSMVRRRPGDDGVKRDELLATFGEYYQARGIPAAVDDIKAMHTELLKIDRGYEEVHSLASKLASAVLQPEQRISGAFAALDYALRQTIRDVERKVEACNGFVDFERNLSSLEGNDYDPHSNTHGLTIACGDVLMLEAYKAGWFDATGRIVLPNLESVSDGAQDKVIANFLNANMWRLWKNVDERVRFLGGKLELFLHELPEWEAQLKELGTDINVDVAFEFMPNARSELFEILANERLDRILEQNFREMIQENIIREKVAVTGGFVALPPKNWVSIDEFHAAQMFQFFTKVDISKTSAGTLLLSERLRGYAALKLLIEVLETEQKTYFPCIPRGRLTSELERCGLVEKVANQFIDLATFRQSSRDLFDQPLIKTGEDNFVLIGASLLFADLPKIMFSSLANEGISIEEKGRMFEESTIAFLRMHGFNARKLKVSRGPNREHEFDYDVAFIWDDYVFFLECKNRGIPMGNPIATYRFNQEMLSHLQQVQRLRKGLVDYPDILEKDFPEAVGKKVVFCLVNALPFAMGKVDNIFFIDNSILTRFFSSPDMGVSAGRLDGGGPLYRRSLRRLWAGPKPTATDFITYLTAPPQLDIAAGYYEMAHKIERLSLGAFAKVIDFQRKDLNADAYARLMKDAKSDPS